MKFKVKNMKNISELTVVIEKSNDGWYVGQVEEIPEAISQGKTIKELMNNIIDAVNLVFNTHKELVAESNRGKKVIKRKIILAQ